MAIFSAPPNLYVLVASSLFAVLKICSVYAVLFSTTYRLRATYTALLAFKFLVTCYKSPSRKAYTSLAMSPPACMRPSTATVSSGNLYTSTPQPSRLLLAIIVPSA